MKLYIGRNPRSIVISYNGYNLQFRRFHSSNTRNLDSQYLKYPTVVINSISDEEVEDKNHYTEVRNRILNGLLGLISVDGNIYVAVISGVQRVGFPRWRYKEENEENDPQEVSGFINNSNIKILDNIFKVLDVDFYSLDNDAWDYLFFELSEQNYEKLINEHPCGAQKKLFSDGTFYFSREFDLSNSIKNHTRVNHVDYIIDNQDSNFIWNKNLTTELANFRSRLSINEKNAFDSGGFLTFIIRGFCKTNLIDTSHSITSITLITRISVETKPNIFDLRGLSEEGKVPNFVESEIIISSDEFLISYTQISCNIPLFWEVVEGQLLSKRHPKLTKSPEHAQVTFDRHFDSLESKYGIVSVVNLLRPRSDTQHVLSKGYKACAENKNIKIVNFESNSEVLIKASHRLLYFLEQDVYELGAYVYDIKKGIYIGKQTGILRISSFDSLKRINIVEKLVCQEVLELATKELESFTLTGSFFDAYERIWSENYYWLNRTYTKNIKNLNKYKKVYVQLFNSRVKLYDLLNSYINKQLRILKGKYTFEKNITIFAGTFNISGKVSKDNIKSWIFPNDSGLKSPADIYLIGLEEVVELTPGRILYPDPYIKQFWEKRLLSTLNKNKENKKYVCLWSNQLGGILLMLFMSEHEYMKVKHIEGDVKKTGFGGISSNKGAVAVSFKYSATRFCIIASHLSAGLDNIEQRHYDYKTINKNIRFSRGLRIKDHDAIIWMGDFNYRITMTNEQVRTLIAQEEYTKLFERDQLNQQMIAGATFPYYNEMEIKFPPTYKFDPGTKIYDTSEKLRIPAWTDRVLSRGDVLKQQSYGSAENILFSDHRPVYATFNARVTVVNEKKKDNISKEINDRITEKLYTTTNEEEKLALLTEEINKDEEETVSKSSSGPVSASTVFPQPEIKKVGNKLPPPSSDLNKWWIGNGKQVKVSLNIDPAKYMLNPHRSPNPFVEDEDEPLFILRTNDNNSA